MAAITAGVVAAGATAYAANRQSKAAKDASRATTQAAQDSNALQLQMFNQQRSDMEPWRQAGMTGLGQYMQMLGLPSNVIQTPAANSSWGMDPGQAYLQANPDVARNPYFAQNPQEHYNRHGQAEGRQWGAPVMQTGGNQPPAVTGAPSGSQPKSISDLLKATPGYQFRFDEGQKAVESSAAAAGGLNSGKTLKALTQYGQNFASNEYGNYMNRLASLAGVGQTATTQVGQWGQNYAQNAGQNLQNAANSRAQSMYARGDAQAGMAGNLAGIAGMVGGYYQNRPQTGMAAGYTAPSQSWASGFGNNTGWLSGGWG
jgi:hypothetical protein